MPLILCIDQDAADWLSVEGVQSRADDDLGADDDAAETAQKDQLILRASGIVAAHLAPRYDVITFGGTNPPTNTPQFVRHLAAIIYTYFLCTRRNMPTSVAVAKEYERALEYLQQLRDGTLMLPEVLDSYEYLPFMTNLTHAGAYAGSKIRALPHISSGAPPSDNSGRKQFQLPAIDSYPFRF